jgi:hypothetical protein
MGGSSGMAPDGTCSSPLVIDSQMTFYSNRVERSSANAFDACPGNGPERVMRWTPPASGRYFLDTFGSSFDTVLYASSNLSCPPTTPNPQLECNDDFSGVQSLLGVQAVQGREMLIVVDSYNSTGGDFILNLRGEAECPQLSLNGQRGALYVSEEFADAAAVLPPTESTVCRGGELGMTFVWQASLSGGYRFNTSGSSFPVVIALRDRCEGAFIDCDSEGDVNNSSEVTASLAQGQVIVIEVSAVETRPLPSFGQFVLSVEPL